MNIYLCLFKSLRSVNYSFVVHWVPRNTFFIKLVIDLAFSYKWSDVIRYITKKMSSIFNYISMTFQLQSLFKFENDEMEVSDNDGIRLFLRLGMRCLRYD
jgi:hypothetical protein